jgi:hypothetical protein
VVGAGRDRIALLVVTDGDCVNHDPLREEPFQSGPPPVGEILAVGEDHQGHSLGMFLRVDRLEGCVQTGAEVGPTGLDRARLQAVQGIEHRAEVFR